jgi:hypothetical protein
MLLRAPVVPVLAPLAALLGGLLLAACSSSDGAVSSGADSGTEAEADPDTGTGDGDTCQAFVPPASFDPTSPVVTFSGDVLPIFSASCAFVSCHGSETGPQGGVYLGTNSALVYSNLVGVASTYLPTMPRIDPGNPGSSFLLHRVDGDACTLPGCTMAACSELMPQDSTPLPQAELLTLRAWIAQGAASDLPDAGPLDAGAHD